MLGLRAYVDAENSSDVFVDWLVEEDTDVAGAIAAHGQAIAADLIVLGTHGYSGFRRFVLGSVTEQVLRRARRPVLAVPPGAGSAASVPMCQQILCPIDFSAGSNRALELAASIAARTHAALTVVHAIELPPQIPELPEADQAGYRAALFARAHADMEKAVAPWRSTCRVHELVLAGPTAREILRLGRELEADLIVMGVHGRGAVDLMLFGSVTQNIVRQAACPVLAVPAVSLSSDRSLDQPPNPQAARA
jgi:nucleotide-binding universal stress UspA family protein